MNDSDLARLPLATVAENAALALFLLDEQQRCTYVNRAAEQLTGFGLAELRGRVLHDHVHHTRPDGTPYPRPERRMGFLADPGQALQPITDPDEAVATRRASWGTTPCPPLARKRCASCAPTSPTWWTKPWPTRG